MKSTLNLIYYAAFAAGLTVLLGLSFAPKVPNTPTSLKAESTPAASTPPENSSKLLHKTFSSSCLLAKNDHYREDLLFSADGTVEFKNRFYQDEHCQGPHHRETLRQGTYSLAEEEDAKWLLTVRHLRMIEDRPAHQNSMHLQKQTASYYEALIKVQGGQLTLENSPGSTLVYNSQLSTSL